VVQNGGPAVAKCRCHDEDDPDKCDHVERKADRGRLETAKCGALGCGEACQVTMDYIASRTHVTSTNVDYWRSWGALSYACCCVFLCKYYLGSPEEREASEAYYQQVRR
jgi:hypothetical protein